jgi:hypothetical protein
MSDWYQQRPTQQQGTVPAQPPLPPNPGGTGYGAPGHPGGPGPSDRSKGPILVGVVIGALVAVVAVLVTILVMRDDATEVATPPSTEPTSTTATTPPTTVPETTVATIDPALVTSATSIENIVSQSSNGRSEIIAVVSEVQSCDVPLSEAQRRVGSVIENRNSVLGQIAGLRVESAPDLNASLDALQRALQESVEANRHYQAWFQWLDGTYYDTYYYDGCWYDGDAPTNVDFQNATAASGRATTAKREFVALYNPIATSLGLRTWSDTEF